MQYYINNHHKIYTILHWSAYDSYKLSYMGADYKSTMLEKKITDLIEYLNRSDVYGKAIYIGERVNATSTAISTELYERLKGKVPYKFFVRKR